MKQFNIGFASKTETSTDRTALIPATATPFLAKKSVVNVYFPSRSLSLSYYNDMFDLKVGDLVYVDGKLEGLLGKVTEVNYVYKIKLVDYQKVIHVIDTSIKGNLYFADSHLVSFVPDVLPYEKVRSWFLPPSEDIYEGGTDSGRSFPLNDLTKMEISHTRMERGHEYYLEERVVFLSLDKSRGRAIVEGSEFYEIEFDYLSGAIYNLTCTCFCTEACKHQFAAMLQLKEMLDFIVNNYQSEYREHFSAISKNVFAKLYLYKNNTGKISLA